MLTFEDRRVELRGSVIDEIVAAARRAIENAVHPADLDADAYLRHAKVAEDSRYDLRRSMLN